MATERTLSIIKPDATRRNLTGKINARFEERGLDTRDHFEARRIDGIRRLAARGPLAQSDALELRLRAALPLAPMSLRRAVLDRDQHLRASAGRERQHCERGDDRELHRRLP